MRMGINNGGEAAKCEFSAQATDNNNNKEKKAKTDNINQ